MNKKNYIIKTTNLNYDQKSIEQLDKMSEIFNDNNIVIMPDYHAGKGCVVGTTMKIKDKVCPNHVGVDICCGVTGYYISEDDLDLEKIPELDKWLREGGIPSGKKVRESIHPIARDFRERSQLASIEITTRDLLSLGTLGGGNHFLEIGKRSNGYVLFVHSGSRNLGLRVAQYYLDVALDQRADAKKEAMKEVIINTKPEHRSGALKEFRKNNPDIDPENAYLTGGLMELYLWDMKAMDKFAKLNRRIMIIDVLDFLGIEFNEENLHNCSHNFVDKNRILRKGAIPAYKGDTVFIPLNMKDGVIIGQGKGNYLWNCSAPHGAGRVLSRGQAKKLLSMDKFKEDMESIYTSSVNENTLDECPDAYKPKDEILGIIGETVDIFDIAKPIYNFKAND